MFLTSLSAVMLVGVCFVGLRGRGDVFSSGSQGWKHTVRLIKAFGLFCFVLSLMILKVVLLLSIMIPKLK